MRRTWRKIPAWLRAAGLWVVLAGSFYALGLALVGGSGPMLRSSGTCIPEITEYGRWKYSGLALSGILASACCAIAALLGAFAPVPRLRVAACAVILLLASTPAAKLAAREDGRGRWRPTHAAQVLGEVIAGKEPIGSLLRKLRGRP